MKLTSESWDEPRQAALIAQIMNAELSLPAACERHELSPETVRRWVPAFRLRTLQALDEKLQQTSLLEAVNGDGLGNAIYSGSVADLPLADLLQTCQMGGKDAVITVTHGRERSAVWCEKGAVIDAESGSLRGDAAVYRILNLEHGQVSVDFRSEPREHTIELPCHVLLVESARHKDECARLLGRLEGPLAIYAPAPGALGADTTLADREVLLLCNGERSIAAVLAASERSDLDTLTTFVSLVERGYLVRRGVSIPPPAPGPRSSLEGWASGKTLRLSFEQSAREQSKRARPPRRPALLVAAAVGLGLGLGSVAWSHLDARGLASSARAVDVASSSTFLVEVSTEPATAEVWLDGVRVGDGRLRRELLRDGKLHQLEVFAPGHVPTTVAFADRAAHFHVVLTELSEPPRRSAVSTAGLNVPAATLDAP